MSDINKTVRDTEANAKEAWRKADGDESLGDKLANAGDRARNAVADAGDEIHQKTDELGRDVAYARGRVEGSIHPVDDTDV